MRFAIVLAVCVAALPSWGQQKDKKIIPHPVTGPITMLEGEGGNIGVSAGEDGLLIIDTQFEYMAPLITDALAKLSPSPIKYVINTHFHGDHTGGNQALAQNSTVVATKNVRARLVKGKDLNDAAFRHSLPTVTYDTPISMYFNGEDIEIIPLGPGHTDGDSMIHFVKSNVYHTGDQFTNGMYPFIDLANGGDVEGYMKNVAKMLEIIPDDAKIIPGHGQLGTKNDLKAFQAMLQETIDLVRKGMAAGKDKDALIKEGLPKKYDEAGKFFVNPSRWISIVYQAYSK